MIKFEKRSPRGKLTRFVWEKKGDLDRIIVALTLLFMDNEDLYSVEFYSSLFGIVNYNIDSEKLTTRSWEGEREAQSVSSLNYHYTAKLLSNIENDEISRAIIEDVLRNTKDLKLNEFLLNILKKLKYLKKSDMKSWV